MNPKKELLWGLWVDLSPRARHMPTITAGAKDALLVVESAQALSGLFLSARGVQAV